MRAIIATRMQTCARLLPPECIFQDSVRNQDFTRQTAGQAVPRRLKDGSPLLALVLQ